MARLELFTTVAGLVAIAALVLLGVLRMIHLRRMRQRGTYDPDGLFVGQEEEEDPARDGPPEFPDFATALNRYVAPLHEAHPDWERLDGAVGIPGRAVFRFERNGIRFEVKGDAPFAPLLAARDWMERNPGEDPLEVFRTGRVGILQLRKEIWPHQDELRIRTN